MNKTNSQTGGGLLGPRLQHASVHGGTKASRRFRGHRTELTETVELIPFGFKTAIHLLFTLAELRRRSRAARLAQKRAQQLGAGFGEEAFRMKLQAIDRQTPMFDGHDFT